MTNGSPLKPWLAAVAVYTLLTVIGFAPGIASIGSQPIAWFEGAGLYYRLWWYSEVLAGRGTLWHLPGVLYPTGMPLMRMSHGMGREILFLALGGARWPQMIGNLFIVSVPVTVALCGFGVLRRLLHGAFLPALLGGWFCGWSSFYLEHVVHAWLAGVEGLIIFLGALLLLSRGVTARRIVLAGAAAAVATWFSIQSLVYIAIIASIYIAIQLLRRDWRSPAALVVAGLLGGVLSAPLLLAAWEAFGADASGMGGDSPMMALYAWRMSLIELVAPDGGVSLMGWVFPLLRDLGLTIAGGKEVYLSIIVLPLAVVGVFSRRRGTGILATVAVVSALIACGPVIALGVQPVPEGSRWGPSWVPGIFPAMMELPIFSSLRTPSRAIVITQVAVGLLAGFGLLRVYTMKVFRHRPRLRMFGAGLILGLHLLDRNQFDFRPHPNVETRFWAAIAAEPGNFAVLDLPYERGMDHYMHYGAYHHKGVIWGFGGRLPDAVLAPLERDLAWAMIRHPEPTAWPTDHDRFARELVRHRVQYLVLHETHLQANDGMKELRSQLIRLIEDPATWAGQQSIERPTLVWQDGVVRAYRITLK